MSALVAEALWELLRYDIVLRTGGFRRIHRSLRKVKLERPDNGNRLETRILTAMRWALSLYWRPALCLQRSVATARMYRRHGIGAEVVIGCRPEPFLSHAWVEINGRVVNDSPVYQQRLQVLERV
ncbi:MAG TPA: lasso peptide biosynthesis B2 protein [Bryobacteraceae bacterium]|nr:lasso peptide biosynthesis B2 protein [Bryobacteraceae bacterium]